LFHILTGMSNRQSWVNYIPSYYRKYKGLQYDTLTEIVSEFLLTQPRAMSCGRLWVNMTISCILECSCVLHLSLKCVCWN